MITTRLKLIAAAALTFLWAGMAPADAHLLGQQSDSLASGLLHPLTGLDHLLAMLAIGLISSRFGGRAIWGLPALTSFGILLGGILGAEGVVMPMLEPAVLISVVLLGALAIGWLRLGPTQAFVLTGLVAVWHGNAHTHDVSGTISTVGFMVGLVVTSGMLQIVGIGSGILMRGSLLRFLRKSQPA